MVFNHNSDELNTSLSNTFSKHNQKDENLHAIGQITATTKVLYIN